MASPKITRALISVSDKLGPADFARGLAAAGVEIFSTGGTRKHLEGEGVRVRDVSAHTGFPEMMDGRLKTLHPKIFGGILGRHDRPDHMQSMRDHEMVPFELVVVNLYPFEATVARQGVTSAEAIEQIDIGGPSLVRAAAKNHDFVAVATDPMQYAEILQQVSTTGGTSHELRRKLAAAAFEMTARYDRAITEYFARHVAPEAAGEAFPERMVIDLKREDVLRYGENPHQLAALYSTRGIRGVNLVSARHPAGKELSYNNLLDLDSALAIVRSLTDPACVVIKHNNPCGAAVAEELAVACRAAMDGDPQSAFGSVLGFNRTLDVATAEVLATPGLFVEAIVAPEFDPQALHVLTTRPKWKDNVRLMQAGRFDEGKGEWQFRHIEGGFLVQQPDVAADPESEWKVATERQPTDAQLADLRFAWAIVRHVKSNAIVLAKERALCGVGAGQMSRVDSVEIAVKKAGDRAQGSALGSDAFFPFADSIEQAAAAGVTAIIQPGGSRRDEEVVAACNQHGLAMVLTSRRHFKH